MNTTTKKARSLTAALITFGSLVTGANGAVLLSFDQVGNDIVMTTSGSVNAANATPASDESFTGPGGGLSSINVSTFASGSQTVNVFFGRAVDSTFDMITPGYVAASTTSGHSLFITKNDYLYIDQRSNSFASTFSPSTSMIFQNMTVQDIGLAAFESGVTYDLWQAQDGAGSSEKIQMRVTYSTVPEPSSSALIGLGCLSLALRRSRR